MILCFQCEDLSKILLVSKFETNWPNINVALYSFTIACALRTKAQVIWACSKENVSVFPYLMTST